MSLSLPPVTPSDRNFVAGRFAVRVIRFLRGNAIRRKFSNKPVKHQLRLSFENVDDDVAAEFLEVHRACRARALPVEVPAEVLAGMEGDLPLRLQAPEGSFWYWAAAPRVRSVRPGVSSVSISLEVDY